MFEKIAMAISILVTGIGLVMLMDWPWIKLLWFCVFTIGLTELIGLFINGRD